MFGDDVAIESTVLGEGEPDLTVVGGIHGDEPSGVRAVRRVLEMEPDLERPVQFVLANPAAAVAHRRSLDVDMNRVFPGDPEADERERRLAAGLTDAVDGHTVLSLHSTHSSVEPMAFVSGDHPVAQGIASRLPVAHVVNHDPVVDGAFTSCECVVSVEAGRQLTEDATQNAIRIVRAFLRLTDASPKDPTPGDPDYYTLVDEVEKPDGTENYQLLVDNFAPVGAGDTYARATDADLELVADRSFHPVLMSETGYDEIFGYKAERAGKDLAAARDAWSTPIEGADG